MPSKTGELTVMIPIFAPGDRPPNPSKVRDFLDYRGVLREQATLCWSSGDASLGRYLHPKGKVGAELFWSLKTLKRHGIVIGPSEGGKSSGFIIPVIQGLIRRGYSVVTVDVVGNLEPILRREAQSLGCKFIYWNPNQPGAAPASSYSSGAGGSQGFWNFSGSNVTSGTSSWNWLRDLRKGDHQAIEGAIQSLLGSRDDERDPFFYDRDVRFLRALIPIAKTVYGTAVRPCHLLDLVTSQSLLEQVIAQRPQLHCYLSNVYDLLSADLSDHAKMVSGLLGKLNVFNVPDVRTATEKEDFSLMSLDQQPTLLVVGYQLGSAQAEQMTGLIFSQLFSYIARRNPNNRPMLMILDEAPQIRKRVDFQSAMGWARNANVGIFLAAQDISQFGDDNQRNQLLNLCNTILTLPGVSAETASYLSKRLGQRRDQVVMGQPQTGLMSDLQQLNQGKSLFEVLVSSFTGNPGTVNTSEMPVLGEREIMLNIPTGTIGSRPAILASAEFNWQPFLVELELTKRSL